MSDCSDRRKEISRLPMLKNVPEDRKLALALEVASAQMIRFGWTCISWPVRVEKFCPVVTGAL